MSRLQQPGTLRSVLVGDFRVSYVPDGAVKMVPSFLFPGTSDADWAKEADFLDESGWLTISSGGLLVERGDRAVLIDAGFGPRPDPVARMEFGIAQMYGGGLLDNLRRLGREPGDIDAIAVTHLHVEHVGWLGHPAFAKVPCLLSAAEWDQRAGTLGVTDEIFEAIAARLRTVGDGEEIMPGVTALALPGHTPGQMGFEVGRRLLAFADVMHSAVQVTHPDWTVLGEKSPADSEVARRHMLNRLADEEVIGFGIHFADVAFGTVRRSEDGFAWDPLP
jgi:glyoxylase-like metal-dependent hydrolase (beta-lactamase superfamily II)